ncbi:FMN-dependent NADH-azoreductase [Zunongwangia sp. HGR-M22]|uniref:FMN-dependent NADH-azoreductase n=1 Tax=Zunongwangia sp. HGR-M22 TaxID=3015168 RepID=UPI0022DE38D7|nr:NAD(P)H-dependent oxidoreductase [Zunongwangia sp. HGR-M22]WBL24033.1 NAD(P)H-dependent oxidoreductase [Zunongwangia sp. HGR-M22]
MKKILHVISSLNGQNSYSLALGNKIVEQLKESYPESAVVEKKLVAEDFPHLTEDRWQAILTPEENRTAAQKENIAIQEEAIKELFDADILVVGAPLYNFGIPSQLKAWIDHLAKAGETFKYTEEGPQGLVTGKKVYIAMSSGGVYSENPGYDFVSEYLIKVFGFLGMTDVELIRVEGVAIPELREDALAKAEKEFAAILA